MTSDDEMSLSQFLPRKRIMNEKLAQNESFGDGYPADIQGSFMWISGFKTCLGPSKHQKKKQAFLRVHP